MLRSEQLNDLATALSKAQAEFTAIPKDSTNPFFRSKYAGLPKVVEVASPILTRHGLSVSQTLGHDESGDTLTTLLLHTSGQFLGDSMHLYLARDKEGVIKDDPQSQGSAVTYGRRYGYMAILGLVADEDDDAQRASKPRAQRAAPSSPKPVLAAESVDEVIAAIKASGQGPEWVRSQLIAVGAQHVPDGQLKRSTIEQLLPGQAAELVGLCAKAREAA